MFSELLEMLKIYSTTLVAGIFCAAALSQLGLHLAAREKGTQVLCVAQGSTLGALLGVLCASIFNSEAAPLSLASMGGNLLPYAAALAGGGGTHLFCESFLQKKQVPKSAFFVAFFGLFWRSCYAFRHRCRIGNCLGRCNGSVSLLKAAKNCRRNF